LNMKHLAAGAIVLTALSILWGCGKKAPPFLPQNVFSLRVEGLKALRQGDQIRLTGSVALPEGRQGNLSGVESSRVYHISYPLESPPCDGCPIPFSIYEEIKPDISGQGQFHCLIGLKRTPGIHYFMVRLVDRNGMVGPPSENTKLVER